MKMDAAKSSSTRMPRPHIGDCLSSASYAVMALGVVWDGMGYHGCIQD